MALENTEDEIMDVRRVLGEAGTSEAVAVVDELNTSTDTTTVFAKNNQIHSVAGVWLATDPDHTGTNFYDETDDAEFNPYTSKITLSDALPDDMTDVLISYTFYKGLSDTVIDRMITNAKRYVEHYTGKDIDWTETSDEEVQLAQAAMTYRAATAALIYQYAPDILQKGFNFSIAEFRVESKTWAGGMGLRDLLDTWNQEVNRYLAILGVNMDFYIPCTQKSSRIASRRRGRTYHGYQMDRNGDVS